MCKLTAEARLFTQRRPPSLLCSIIEPLASRCSKFRFKPLEMDSMMTRLKYIAHAEGVDVPHEVRLVEKACDPVRRHRAPLLCSATSGVPRVPLFAGFDRDADFEWR
ncbi:hypothetical protein EON66_06795 [archaeon]|nr:MAG: hypothetical protein EON66_06795 [archaeon]